MQSTIGNGSAVTAIMYCYNCNGYNASNQLLALSCPSCRSDFVENLLPSSDATMPDFTFDLLHATSHNGYGYGYPRIRIIRNLTPASTDVSASNNTDCTVHGNSSGDVLVELLEIGVSDLVAPLFYSIFWNRLLIDIFQDLNGVASNEDSGPPPIAKEKIETLITKRSYAAFLEEKRKSGGEGSEKKRSVREEENCCAICLEQFTNKDQVAELKCKHTLHFDCISEWLMVRGVCPICRKELVEE